MALCAPLAVGLALLATLPASAANGSSTPKPKPQVLWQAYPLSPTSTRPAAGNGGTNSVIGSTRPVSAPIHARDAAPATAGSSSTKRLVGLAAVAVAAVAVILLVRRRRVRARPRTEEAPAAGGSTGGRGLLHALSQEEGSLAAARRTDRRPPAAARGRSSAAAAPSPAVAHTVTTPVGRASQPRVVKAERVERRPSPAPERRPSPAPELRPSPAPELRPSPAPELRPSPAPELRPSPAPELRPSPAPELRPSPAPELRPSPAPELRPSPAPELRPSPAPELRPRTDEKAALKRTSEALDPSAAAKLKAKGHGSEALKDAKQRDLNALKAKLGGPQTKQTPISSARKPAGVSTPPADRPAVRPAPPPPRDETSRRPRPTVVPSRCRIDWRRNGSESRFCALTNSPSGEEAVVLRSPSFEWPEETPPTKDVPDVGGAYVALVSKLVADGWMATGSGDQWYALELMRTAEPLRSANQQEGRT